MVRRRTRLGLSVSGTQVDATVPAAGRLQLNWYAYVPVSGKRPVLVGRSTAHAVRAGTIAVTITLTRTGRTLLAEAHVRTLVAQITFRPTRGAPSMVERRSFRFSEARVASAIPAARRGGGAAG